MPSSMRLHAAAGRLNSLARTSPTFIRIGAFDIARQAARWYSIHSDVPRSNKSKVWDSADAAVKDIKSGSTILVGGMSSSPSRMRILTRLGRRFRVGRDSRLINFVIFIPFIYETRPQIHSSVPCQSVEK